MNQTTQKILVTLGEPAGIGTDLMVLLAQRDDLPPCLIIGDADCLMARASLRGLPLQLNHTDLHADLPTVHTPGTLNLHHLPLQSPATPGKLQTQHADDVVYSLQIATEACLAGQAHAWVTAPIHKAQLQAAGHPFSGHTAWLAQACQQPNLTMFFHSPTLKVALVTDHLPLTKVPQAITENAIRSTIGHTHQYLKSTGISRPRITVCGLNPHAGESGHLGHEEQRLITPTLDAMRAEGYILQGPVPACTAFVPTLQKQSDAYVCMYHDQALPVIKALCFDSAVNVTLGLPFVRTSPDHGTALGLAGHGAIQCDSMLAALHLAADARYDKSP